MQIVLASFILLTVPLFACRTERLSVAVGKDKDARLIDSLPQSTTVQALAGFPKPRKYPNNSRLGAAEHTTWEVRAAILKFKLDDDGDYHVVVGDKSGHTMIVEIQASACLKGSPFLKVVKEVRRHFEERFPRNPPRQRRTPLKPIQVIIHGVGFFDRIHGQPEAAPNGIELSPVTLICFENEACEGI
jgi:hypothetical protein